MQPVSLEEDKTKARAIIKQVSYVVARASYFIPMRQKCLIDALVTKKILYLFNIHSSVIFGVGKDSQNKLSAHAWLMYEDTVIIGKKYADKYLEIKKY